MRECRRLGWWVGCAILIATTRADAAFVVDVGTNYVLPDRPGQRIEIRVTGTEPVEGLNVFVQIADGGVELGGSVRGPRISGIDIVNGTIFSRNNLGQFTGDTFPQAVAAYTLTATATPEVIGSGVLAVLTVDTTGILDGTWALLLADTKMGTSDFAGASISISNGSIVVIPEPHMVLGVMGAVVPLLLSSRAQRRRLVEQVRSAH